MKPIINSTEFGSITVNGEVFNHDIWIDLSGEVKKRKKKLSKKQYGTSHILSREEAKYIYEKGAEGIIIGGGQSGMLTLSEEAITYFEKKKCSVEIWPTPQSINRWNEKKGKFIGLFHITC